MVGVTQIPSVRWSFSWAHSVGPRSSCDCTDQTKVAGLVTQWKRNKSRHPFVTKSKAPTVWKIARWVRNRWWWILKWSSFTGRHVFNTWSHTGIRPERYGCCCARLFFKAFGVGLTCEKKACLKTTSFQGNKIICQCERSSGAVCWLQNWYEGFSGRPFSNHQESWSFPNSLHLNILSCHSQQIFSI